MSKAGHGRAGGGECEEGDRGHWRGGSVLIKPGNGIFQWRGRPNMADDGTRIFFISLMEV